MQPAVDLRGMSEVPEIWRRILFLSYCEKNYQGKWVGRKHKKIDCVVFGTVIDAIICNNKVTHRAMVSAFSVWYLESIFFCHGEWNQ